MGKQGGRSIPVIFILVWDTRALTFHAFSSFASCPKKGSLNQSDLHWVKNKHTKVTSLEWSLDGQQLFMVPFLGPQTNRVIKAPKHGVFPRTFQAGCLSRQSFSLHTHRKGSVRHYDDRRTGNGSEGGSITFEANWVCNTLMGSV